MAAAVLCRSGGVGRAALAVARVPAGSQKEPEAMAKVGCPIPPTWRFQQLASSIVIPADFGL